MLSLFWGISSLSDVRQALEHTQLLLRALVQQVPIHLLEVHLLGLRESQPLHRGRHLHPVARTLGPQGDVAQGAGAFVRGEIQVRGQGIAGDQVLRRGQRVSECGGGLLGPPELRAHCSYLVIEPLHLECFHPILRAGGGLLGLHPVHQCRCGLEVRLGVLEGLVQCFAELTPVSAAGWRSLRSGLARGCGGSFPGHRLDPALRLHHQLVGELGRGVLRSRRGLRVLRRGRLVHKPQILLLPAGVVAHDLKVFLPGRRDPGDLPLLIHRVLPGSQPQQRLTSVFLLALADSMQRRVSIGKPPVNQG
mmetsp:Transcript_38833/g.101558  ORF Transcript_38833/g.101558 Transcript_38833/m.101558 type:complete len:306 (+) Transcript_38833:1737-2654(+)